MMERLEAKGRRIGAAAVARAVERLAGVAREALPGVEVSGEAERVVLRGRGLWRRALGDPALRWLGGLLR